MHVDDPIVYNTSELPQPQVILTQPISTVLISESQRELVNIESEELQGSKFLNSQVISRSQFLIAKSSLGWMKIREVRLRRLAAHIPAWLPAIPPMWQWLARQEV